MSCALCKSVGRLVSSMYMLCRFYKIDMKNVDFAKSTNTSAMNIFPSYKYDLTHSSLVIAVCIQNLLDGRNAPSIMLQACSQDLLKGVSSERR